MEQIESNLEERLRDVQSDADKQLMICLTAFVAETASDKRDSVMKQDLRKFHFRSHLRMIDFISLYLGLKNKIGQFVILGLNNTGKVK